MKIVCEASGLSYFAGRAQLLREADIKLCAGEVVTLVGPNGAGKSTLLRTLAGEHAASSGDVFYGGRSIRQTQPWALAIKRSVMSQSLELSFPFRAEEIIGIGVQGIGRRMTAQQKQAIVNECARLADVERLLPRDYQTLSGGERQRVQFARALAQLRAGASLCEEQVLFLDEPVSNLDLAHQWRLMETVARIARGGVAVLVVVHDINLAATFADRIVMMKHGRIVEQGDVRAALSEKLISEVFDIELRASDKCASLPRILPQTHVPRGLEASPPAGRAV